MTTLNTIIEEEKKEFEKGFWWTRIPDKTRDMKEIQDFLTTAMQRAFEAGKAETIKGERERIAKDFGDFAHKHYLGCYADELGNWHYSYDNEVVYLIADYLSSLTPQPSNEETNENLTHKQ